MKMCLHETTFIYQPNLSLDRNWRKIEPLLGILSTTVYESQFHIVFFIRLAYKYVVSAVHTVRSENDEYIENCR